MDAVATVRIESRARASVPQGAQEPNLSDTLVADRSESDHSGGGVNASANLGRSGAGTSPAAPRRTSGGQRLTRAGHGLAVVLPDGRGFCLVEPLSGTPFRTVNRPEREVQSLLADPAGRRLITIERIIEDPVAQAMEGMSASDPTPSIEWQVNLWDLDHLDQPKSLPWARLGPVGPPRGAGGRSRPPAPTPPIPSWPLVAISPDRPVVAVGSWGGAGVKLFSAVDGKELPPIRTGGGIELTAVALGANGMLATAGTNTGPARGNTVRLWDTDTGYSLGSLTPTQQHVTFQMRYSPQGTLLALVGLGPIELFDPAAHSLVAVLRMSDQPSDLAFSPDGRTLAAGGRAALSSTWTVLDSTARTQLSGFEARLSSLAFSDDGTLAGGGSDGGVWTWRNGRCPNVGSPPDPSSPEIDRRRGPNRGMGNGPGNNRDQRRTSLAFDDRGRLIAHDPFGLRVWPPGSIAGATPPIIKLPMPPVPTSWWNPTLLARTTDGRVVALVRSSAILLWHSEAPVPVQPVIPPPRSGGEPAPATKTELRGNGTTGPEAARVRCYAVQVAPAGDRLYLLADNNMQSILHVWALDATTGGYQAREVPVTAPLPERLASLGAAAGRPGPGCRRPHGNRDFVRYAAMDGHGFDQAAHRGGPRVRARPGFLAGRPRPCRGNSAGDDPDLGRQQAERQGASAEPPRPPRNDLQHGLRPRGAQARQHREDRSPGRGLGPRSHPSRTGPAGNCGLKDPRAGLFRPHPQPQPGVATLVCLRKDQPGVPKGRSVPPALTPGYRFARAITSRPAGCASAS